MSKIRGGAALVVNNQSPYVARNWAVPFHQSLARWKALVLHRRCGKTTATLNHHIIAATCDPWERHRLKTLAPQLTDAQIAELLRGRVYGHVLPTRTWAKLVAWEPLKYYGECCGGVAFETDLLVDFPVTGARVHLFGGDEPDKLRGPAFSGISFDEYGLHRPNIFSEVISKNLADHLGYAIFLGTIKGKNQLYKTWKSAQGAPEWFSLWQDIDLTLKTEDDAAIVTLRQAMYDDQLLVQRGVMTQEEFDQEWYCFPAGTLIATSRGQVPIESIRQGDTVLTHRNRWRPVTATMNREYSGDIAEIVAFGFPRPLRCTPEHPLLVYDKDTRCRAWKPAQDLQPGDYIVTPKANVGAKVISETWAQLIAWFVCEGSSDGNRVTFSLNGGDQAEVAHVCGLLSMLGYTATWVSTGGEDSASGGLRINDVKLADRLVAWCGSGAHHKRIPFDIISGHEQLFFEELIRGDGCIIEPVQGGHRYTYNTVSLGLAFDVMLLASTLGRRAGITIKPPQDLVICGRATHSTESYAVNIPKGVKVNHSRVREAFPSKLGMVYRVKAVTLVPFAGQVFNIAVKEDESYVAFGRAVHNCALEAAIKGSIYGKALSAMRKDNRIRRVPHDPALPVFDVWDLGKGQNMSVGLYQRIAREVHMIEYLEGAESDGIEQMIGVLKRKPYVYGKHFAPHDIRGTELSIGKTRFKVAKDLGWEFDIVADIGLEDGINAARLMFARLWADEEKCEGFLEAIAHYRRPYNDRLQTFGDQPLHDWSSHPADQLRYAAVAEEKMTNDKRTPRRRSTGGNAGGGANAGLGWMG